MKDADTAHAFSPPPATRLSRNVFLSAPSRPRIIAKMLRGLPILLLLPATAWAAEKTGVPVPVSPDWAPWLLLVLLWVLATAAVIGPVVRYFRAQPRSTQAFSDDRPIH